MPENIPKPLDSQQNQDSYSFRKPFLKLEQFINRIFNLLFGIVLLIIISIITVLILNYLNIVPLSQKFPNLLFDLPHQEFPNQTQINLKLLNDPKIFSTSSNSWFITAKLFKTKDDSVYFYYKDTLISLKKTINTTCGTLVNRVSEGNGQSAGIEDVKCNQLLTNNYQNKEFLVEYTIDENNNFTILSTQLD
jgi:hypothetical protein